MTKEIKTFRANTKDEQFEKAFQDFVEKVDTIKADRGIMIASNGVELIVSVSADDEELHNLVYSTCRAFPKCAGAIASGVLAYIKEAVK